MESIIRYLDMQGHKKLYFTETGCDMINCVQEMITRERIVIRDEKKIIVPGCELYLTDSETINGFTTKIEDSYCIFINKGVLEEQKTYLEHFKWDFLDIEKKENYINDVIKYGFYFLVFHEYAHIYCGHVDACLTDFLDKKAQECEADMFALDYLVSFIFHFNGEEIVEELEKMYFAVFFLLQKMQKENYLEIYNDKIIQNYYDEERVDKRDHPLDAQRIMYLFEMLNIVIVDEKAELLPIKESILEKLKILKGVTDLDLPKREIDYMIVNESVQELKKTIANIRKKIPRINESMLINN